MNDYLPKQKDKAREKTKTEEGNILQHNLLDEQIHNCAKDCRFGAICIIRFPSV